MTTIAHNTVVCAVCGMSSSHMGIASTNYLGSADLDTRPPEMARSTMWSWVQRCPGCGYCARQIAEAPPVAGEIVSSQAYQDQLRSPGQPELANSFVCAGMIFEKAGDTVGAAWASIRAAWVSDDGGADEAAVDHRLEAVRRIWILHKEGKHLAAQPGADAAITADLLRRAGRLEEALDLADRALPETEHEIIRAVLLLEKTLISKSDLGCHKVEEAVRS